MQLRPADRRVGTGLRAREIVEITLTVLLGALVLKLFVLDAVTIPSSSMESTLLKGDFILVNKLIYGSRLPNHTPFSRSDVSFFRFPKLRDVGRGDVIVFELPSVGSGEKDSDPVYFVKRCIALGGDRIEIRNGTLIVNGEKVLWTGAEPIRRTENYGPVDVPKRGDTIRLSDASYKRWSDLIRREGHTIEYSSTSEILIDGKPTTTYTVERNYLFVLGDNRAHSYDSRYWGFLPEENVVGQAMVVYWSIEPSNIVRSISDFFTSIRWNRIGMFIH